MMSRATVELDFFGLEKDNSSSAAAAAAAAGKSQFQKFVDRRRSLRGLQGAISKMNPELIKSVIASGLTNQIEPSKSQTLFPTLPVLNPEARATSDNGPETAPLTIFYNGTVSVFNVTPDKAESILKLAVEGSAKSVESVQSEVITPPSNDQQQQLLDTLNEDLPIARKKSLQRFLQKRKERNAMDHLHQVIKL